MKMKEFGPGGVHVPGTPPWIRQCYRLQTKFGPRTCCHLFHKGRGSTPPDGWPQPLGWAYPLPMQTPLRWTDHTGPYGEHAYLLF